MTLHARTKAVEETQALGASLAELARPGDLVVLAGDLGAGKTAFAQGFGRGLGVEDLITSPTFTLARSYRGRIVLHHLDVYRVENLVEVLDLDLPELLDDAAVVLIEWGDAIAAALPADYLEIRLFLGDADDERRLELRAVGPSWASRTKAVTAAVDPWLVEA